MSEPFNVVADAREAMHMAQALGDVRGPMHKRSAECRERMSNLRSALIIQYPFFGIIACKLKLVEDNIHCPTLATDGKHMFYNVGYVMGVADEDKEEYVTKFKEAFPDATDAQIEESTKGLTDKETTFGIVHEIMHCMFEHFIRRNAREPKKWNRAADYAINQIILREPAFARRSDCASSVTAAATCPRLDRCQHRSSWRHGRNRRCLDRLGLRGRFGRRFDLGSFGRGSRHKHQR